MPESLFISMDSSFMARQISGASHTICYAAPGLFEEVARAIVDASKAAKPRLMVSVSLDFDESVLRMGFGDLQAVKILREGGIEISSALGLRAGILIIDDKGFIFTPAARLLESEKRSGAAPNAMRLSSQQVEDVLPRLSYAAKAAALAEAKTAAQKQEIEQRIVEIAGEPLPDSKIADVARRLDEVPPVPFDIARQVRVFTAYLQYVELSLSGAAVQRRRLSIPPSILKIGGNKDLEGRLRTTFDLIERSGELSSVELEKELKEIRDAFTPSLGKEHGRVLLKSAKHLFEGRVAALRKRLTEHQEKVRKELQAHLDAARVQVVDFYLPLVMSRPPDSLHGQFLKFTEATGKAWLNRELDSVFPKAEALIQKMHLALRYKDVTFETLNRPDFLESIQKVYPDIPWEKAYEDFQAAGEREER